MKEFKFRENLDKVAAAGAIVSIVGSISLDARTFSVIRCNSTLSTILIIASILGYLVGTALGIIVLLLSKEKTLTNKGKLCAWLAIILGFIGLSYIIFGNFILYHIIQTIKGHGVI